MGRTRVHEMAHAHEGFQLLFYLFGPVAVCVAVCQSRKSVSADSRSFFSWLS
jgi:hypothetical protein